MSPDLIFQSLHQTITSWEKHLEHYSLEQLCMKPGKNSWSLGQVYIHLLDTVIDYNFPQIEICISGNRGAKGKKSEEGSGVFAANGFPDKKLKGPPGKAPDQPESIDQIKKGLKQVKKTLAILKEKIIASQYNGKTKHPGLRYLDAWEWMQFIDFHFRHHLRQKETIDRYLKSIKGT